MTHHEEPQIALHLLASTPNAICVECFADPERDPVWDRLDLDAPRPIDGRLSLSKRPGFGMRLDEEMVERYRIEET